MTILPLATLILAVTLFPRMGLGEGYPPRALA